jgi:DUF4097 and DUF4098 domain-containing protein YvlB
MHFVYGEVMPFWQTFDFSIGDSGSKTDQTEKLGTFTKVKAELDIMNLTIQTGKEYSISYSCPQKLIPVYSISDDGTLTIKQKGGYISGYHGQECKVTIVVPEKTSLEKLDVNVDAGNLILSGITAENVDIEADAGNVKMENASLGKVVSSVDAGNLTMSDTAFDSLDAESDAGNVTLSGIDSVNEYSIQASTDLGKVTIAGQGVSKEYHSSQDGTKYIKIESDLGNVTIN